MTPEERAWDELDWANRLHLIFREQQREAEWALLGDSNPTYPVPTEEPNNHDEGVAA